ncbi:MAG: hypothetical protein AAGD14_12880 [Planctomycetota bacterium]
MRAVALLVLLAACGRDPIEPVPLALRVECDTSEIGFGEPFPLVVERVWPKGLVPSTWRADALAPLRLERDKVIVDESDTHVRERTHYRAFAFAAGALTLPAVPFGARARDGSREERTLSEPWELRVRPQLDPDAPGAPEWAEPRGWSPLWLLALLLLVPLLLRRRPRVEAAPVVEPEEDWRAPFLALEPDAARFHLELAELVRGRIGARERTTEEIGRTATPAVVDVLRACDLVNFARQPASRDEANALRDRALEAVA